MKIVHVEKSPYPDSQFKSSHWQVEVTPQDLGLPEPTSTAEATTTAQRLLHFAKWTALLGILMDGCISRAEFDLLMQNYSQGQSNAGVTGSGTNGAVSAQGGTSQ